ncbi:MAG TPA: CPBP family intramembrane glutamic endopeptidase [Thermoanaerobaculia bacterium]|nr:CPBP family intramembrane glutamic endopeptidase [Thermoanaerobaculia bacterium]
MNVLIPVLIAIVVFVVSATITRLLPDTLRTAHPWLSQAVVKGLLVALSVGLMRLSRRPFADFGFRRPTAKSKRWIALGFLLGAIATVTMLSLGLQGLQSVLKGYTFPMIIFWVWIVSSVSEEIFVRGWFQSALAHRGVDMRTAIIASGLLFGSMHLSLLVAGIPPPSVAILVTFTATLGLLCAYLRATRDSLLPAIYAHIAFNLGGAFAGVLFVVIRKLAHRH